MVAVKGKVAAEPDPFINEAKSRLLAITKALAASGNFAKRETASWTIFLDLEREDYDAFSLADGKIFITRNLFDRMPTDDSLAFVLAHEMSHVNLKHHKKSSTRDSIAEIDSYGPIIASAKLLATLESRRFSRKQETEADLEAVKLLHSAGFDKHSAITALRIVEALEKSPGRAKFMRTHPLTTQRIIKLQQYLKAKPIEGDDFNTQK
jgi:Zn-dependent protease with chaperone function